MKSFKEFLAEQKPTGMKVFQVMMQRKSDGDLVKDAYLAKSAQEAAEMTQKDNPNVRGKVIDVYEKGRLKQFLIRKDGSVVSYIG